MLLWSLHRRHCDHGESTVSPVYVPLRILQYGSDYCSDAPCQWLPGISDSICVRHWIVQNHNMQSPTTEHSAIFAIQILRYQMCISSAMLRCFSEFHVTFVTMTEWAAMFLRIISSVMLLRNRRALPGGSQSHCTPCAISIQRVCDGNQ